MKGKMWLIFVILLLVGAGLLFFAATGHDYVAALLVLIAALIVIYRFGGHGLRVAVTVLLVIGIAAFIIIEIPIVREARTDAPDDCEYVIVLGAGLKGDVPTLSLRNRLDAALEWLEAHPDCVAVVSGGQGPGENMPEGEAMGIWLEARGIEPERIIVEDKSTSTMENLENSFALIREAGGEPDGNCAIITSEYHLCRAKLMARSLGVEAWGVAAHTSWPSLMLNYFIREAFAVTYYRIFGAI
ncbi:MAG TPA: YdcF family protein [Candidatus Scatomorpha pullistercoris]|uniref:YdcF family protein n=1 Tax=Candidatus Scatomorpha pullistercoris TaxID=2840929 RepID=A0A9D1G673_9FIRM|nr:YdcF family protein [Candidatus Scatomorpha pullistercoris]